MENKNCPNLSKCPIFLKKIVGKQNVLTAYRLLYCEAGPQRYKKCSCFQVIHEAYDAIPEIILPKSKLSVNEIIQMMTSSMN